MKVKITKFWFVWSICFLVYYLPANYVIGNTLTTIRNVLYFIILVYAGIVKFLLSRKYRIDLSTIVLICLFIWVILGSTIINYLIGNDVDFDNTRLYISGSLGLILLCDIGYIYSPKKAIKNIITIGIIMCSLNALTFFIYYGKGGMYTGRTISIYGNKINKEVYFLLGRDNATFFHSWPILVTSWYYYFKYNNSFRMFALFAGFSALIVSAYFYTWSAMAAFVLLFECILVFVLRNKKSRVLGNRFWWYDFRKIWLIGLTFSILLSAQIIIPYLLPMINNVFKKSVTLSYRTYIWEKSYFYIVKSPIIGYGTEGSWTIMSKLGINHTHNLFLETLYRGGILGLLILILYFEQIVKEVKRCRITKGSKFLMASVFIFLISSSVEYAYYRYHFVIVFMLLRKEIMPITSNYNMRRKLIK